MLILQRILVGVKGSDCFCYLIDGKILSAFGTRAAVEGMAPRVRAG